MIESKIISNTTELPIMNTLIRMYLDINYTKF
jgi:hypothetical protein